MEEDEKMLKDAGEGEEEERDAMERRGRWKRKNDAAEEEDKEMVKR